MENERKSTSLLHKIENNFKLQLLSCVLLSFLVLGAYFILDTVIVAKVNYKIINDNKLINQVENVYVVDNKITLSGYAFYLDANSNDSKISILLRNVKDSNEIWANVEQVNRYDVDSYYHGEYNYDYSGFYANVKENKLKTDECYEIIVKLDYKIKHKPIESKTVLTNRYLLNGELYSYNPFEVNRPDINVASTLLQKVFLNGKLCFYNEGMYVYQYNNQLFWIANQYFDFDKDGLTRIPYHIYTTQIEKLPDNRIQYGFSNHDFNFEDYELIEENTEPYRVVVKDIPDEYTITYIKTGVYDTVNREWIWNKQINMNKIFE